MNTKEKNSEVYMNSNQKYRFVVRKATVKRGKALHEFATICLQDAISGQIVPHPVTDFIKTVYANGENFNTQKAPAESIKKFLNWLLIENQDVYCLDSFEDLGFHHGVDYLNYLKDDKKLQRDSVKTANRYLTSFYDFLHKRKILPDHMRIDIADTATGKKILVSPFSELGAKLPAKKLKEAKVTAFPDNRLITVFIEVAQRIAPEIAFGIYLQMFGGLRRGEVVNLRRQDLRPQGDFASQGLTVTIEDHAELFNRLADTSKNQTKNERVQPIQLVDYLPNLYKDAFERSSKSLSTNPHGALFIDNRGKPMSGAVYEKRFVKVKKKFLEHLRQIGSPHLSYLMSANWGTHIGRGVYTNLIASLVSSPNELAVLRGDKSLASALAYMSMEKVKKEVQEGLEHMFAKGEV
jgi:integrase